MKNINDLSGYFHRGQIIFRLTEGFRKIFILRNIFESFERYIKKYKTDIEYLDENQLTAFIS